MAKRKSAPAKKPAQADEPEVIPEARVRARVRDPRRWIYGGLDLAFAIIYGYVVARVIPNRLPLASFHMWTIPILIGAAGVGMFLGDRHGWWVAVIAASGVLLSTFLLIVRIVISAAFLAGVYGAFGQGAVVFAIVLVALVIELVALLPLVQVKYMMSRAGKRAYGMS
jgi:hypothetical protein